MMGWYMVKSGLVLDPHVSHYRLAIHLLLAILLYILFFWQFMKRTLAVMLLPTLVSVSSEKAWCKFSIAVLVVQLVLGAFVAGLNAGLVYNQFPLMGEGIIPPEIKISTLSLLSFSDPVFVQFAHRMTAYLLSIIIIIFCIKGRKITNKKFLLALICIFILLVMQVLVGIITLVYNVPIVFALLHQMGGVVLLSCLVWAYFLLHNS
jgi:cytochrome c oxidase assembly protein subunit 15